MDKNELERLAAILSDRARGYRDSASTEARELRQILLRTRPDLYEMLITEEQRESTKAAETKALVHIKKGRLLERPRYNDIPDLVNSVTVSESGQQSLYEGRLVNMKVDLGDDYIIGHYTLEKYAVFEKEKILIHFSPLSINKEMVPVKKKKWKVKSTGYYFYHGHLFKGSIPDYKSNLMSNIKDAGIDLDSSLIDAVFDPMNKKLKEIYSSFKSQV